VVASLSLPTKDETKVGDGSGEVDSVNGEELFTVGQAGYGSESGKVDHVQLWYGGGQKQKGGVDDVELYKKGQDSSDVSQMVLTIPEAEETLKDIQYATALGAYHDVDVRTREKFSLWVMFNPAMLQLLESLYKITSNVDYSKVV
jgi:hypothetical protein